MDSQDPVAAAAVHAIRTGDTAALASLLAGHPGLAAEQIHQTRTPLHVAADWPGYFPNGPATVRLLIDAGADPNAAPDGPRAETPLHWAASSDDADVADALISGGANIDTPGGSIGWLGRGRFQPSSQHWPLMAGMVSALTDGGACQVGKGRAGVS